MKNFSRGFIHTVTIYGSEHSEIQHYTTYDISIMCVTILLICLNFDIDIEPTTIYIKLV